MNNLMTLNDSLTVASAMAKSHMFPDIQSQEQALVKILAGAEVGLGSFAAMTGIHIIKGKAVMGANLIATLIKNDPRYNYKVQAHDDKSCVVLFFEDGEPCGESSFTIDEARTAGLLNNPTWQKYPRNMLFARAISNGARWYAAGIFGGAPVYTPDELGVNVDEDGEIMAVSYHQVSAPQPLPQIEAAKMATQPQIGLLHGKLKAVHGDGWEAEKARVLTAKRLSSTKELTSAQISKWIDSLVAKEEQQPQTDAVQAANSALFGDEPTTPVHPDF